MFDNAWADADDYTAILLGAVPPALDRLIPDLMALLAAHFPADGANDQEFHARAVLAALNLAWVRAYAACRWPETLDALA